MKVVKRNICFLLFSLKLVILSSSCDDTIPQEVLDKANKKRRKGKDGNKSGSKPTKKNTILQLECIEDEKFIDTAQVYSHLTTTESSNHDTSSIPNKTGKSKKICITREQLRQLTDEEKSEAQNSKMSRAGKLYKLHTPFDETIVVFTLRFLLDDYNNYRLRYNVNGEHPADKKTIQVIEAESNDIPYNSFKDLAFRKGSEVWRLLLDKATPNSKKKRIFCFKVDYSKVGENSKIEFFIEKKGNKNCVEKLIINIP